MKKLFARQDYLGTWVIVLIVGILLLGSAIGITISPWTKVVNYLASGEVLVTSTQWENLKATFAETNVELSNVKILDSDGDLLVQFTSISVNPDFPYGTITKEVGKDFNKWPAQLECILFILGGVGTLVGTLGTCSIYYGWDK